MINLGGRMVAITLASLTFDDSSQEQDQNHLSSGKQIRYCQGREQYQNLTHERSVSISEVHLRDNGEKYRSHFYHCRVYQCVASFLLSSHDHLGNFCQ